MDIDDLDGAILLYERGILTTRGLLWFYLHTKGIEPHEVNPKRASIDLNISQASVYLRLKEIINLPDHYCSEDSP